MGLVFYFDSERIKLKAEIKRIVKAFKQAYRMNILGGGNLRPGNRNDIIPLAGFEKGRTVFDCVVVG